MDSLEDVQHALPGLLAAQFDDVAAIRGGWSIARGTARAFVHAVEMGEHVFVTVQIPVVSGVPASPEVFEYVATTADGFLFGGLSCARSGDEVSVQLRHLLLADSMQRGELVICLDRMLAAADAWDGPFVELFGGRCFRG